MNGRLVEPVVADADALAVMAAEAFCDTFAHLYPPADLTAHLAQWMPPAKCAAQIADSAAWPMRLWRDELGIAGYVKLGLVDLPLPEGYGDAADSIELHHLYALKRVHGSGAAGRLMDWAVAHARAAGFKRLVLSVYIDNHRAQRFYARYGFSEIGKNPYRVGDRIDDDRVWMARL